MYVYMGGTYTSYVLADTLLQTSQKHDGRPTDLTAKQTIVEEGENKQIFHF